MASNIPIRDIVLSGTPTASAYIVFDDGQMKKGLVSDLADGVRPVASQSEAQAGTDNAKVMTALRVKDSIASEVGVSVASAASVVTAQSDIDAHEADTANPHGVTKAQVGLSNVPNVDATNASNIGSGTLANARLTSDLQAVAGLSSTGIIRRTGSGTATAGTAVANSELATMANNTFKGNVSGSTAAPSDLTAAQVAAALPVATTSANGLAPSLPNDALKYLDGTGNFSVPAGSGAGTTIRGARISFNNTNFSFIPTNPNQYKLPTWTGVEFNVGGLWAAEPHLGAAFIPASGTRLVQMHAQIWIVSGLKTTGTASVVAKWIKNATVNGSGILLTGTEIATGLGSPSFWGADSGVIQSTGIDMDFTNGDYYGLFFFFDTPSLGSAGVIVDGNPFHSFAMVNTFE